jgi:septum formation inhibitor-activating ATPase MinD
VDRNKAQPEEWLQGVELEYVPTIVVRRDGQELGRIVEESPAGIEQDLLALLLGESSGVVTANPELLGKLSRPEQP